MNRLWAACLETLFRTRCAGCEGWTSVGLCPACEAAWPLLPTSRCAACALPLAMAAPGHDCPADESGFTAVSAAGAYEGVARQAVRRLKYEGRTGLARPLAARLVESDDFPQGTWCVVPVPLHPRRRRERGFNQAALLAREVGRCRRWPVADLLLRNRPTSPQHGLGRSARQANMAGAFQCKRSVLGQRILLIDDVMTTGVTLREAAQALRKAGAADVRVAVIARAY